MARPQVPGLGEHQVAMLRRGKTIPSAAEVSAPLLFGAEPLDDMKADLRELRR